MWPETHVVPPSCSGRTDCLGILSQRRPRIHWVLLWSPKAPLPLQTKLSEDSIMNWHFGRQEIVEKFLELAGRLHVPLSKSQGRPGHERNSRRLDAENARAQGDRPPTVTLCRGDFLVGETALRADC